MKKLLVLTLFALFAAVAMSAANAVGPTYTTQTVNDSSPDCNVTLEMEVLFNASCLFCTFEHNYTTVPNTTTYNSTVAADDADHWCNMTVNMGYNTWEGKDFYTRVWCNDTGSVTNRTSFNVTTIEDTAPSISISSPTDGTTYKNPTQTLAWSASDNCDPTLTCVQAIWDGNENRTKSYTFDLSGSRSEAITWMKGWDYTVLTYCTDGISNAASDSVSISFSESGVVWICGDNYCDIANQEICPIDCEFTTTGTAGNSFVVVIVVVVVAAVLLYIIFGGKKPKRKKGKRTRRRK